MRWQIAALTLARLGVNTGVRMVYPFLPALARGAGVELSALYRLVTARNLVGLLGPFFGPLSERYGRKPVIIGAALLLALGALIVVIWPAYWALGATLIILSTAKVIFDPAMQAYIGDRVPYHRRGRALAVTETAWAGSLLLGAPAVGLIIARQGWQAPFLWLAGLMVGAALILWRLLPPAAPNKRRVLSWGDAWRVLRRHPVIWLASLYLLLVMGANEILFIVYGDWMESSFGLSLASLGLASGLIGGAEISGELAAGFAVDRFGKRPVVITAGLLNAAMYLIIPYTGETLAVALVSLSILFISFEITIVGGVPLLTELVPGARALVMAMTIGAAAVGRALGSMIGPPLWQRWGLAGAGAAAAVVALTGILVLARWVREGTADAEEAADDGASVV
jgi:predicted MFS family arabinose efflux permease